MRCNMADDTRSSYNLETNCARDHAHTCRPGATRKASMCRSHANAATPPSKRRRGRHHLLGELLKKAVASVDPGLELRLHGLVLHAFHSLELLGDVVGALGLHLGDVVLLALSAAVLLGNTALGLEGVHDELLELLVVAAALVLVLFAVDEVLDGGVARNALCLAERLAVGGAVDVSNEDAAVALVVAGELVEGGFHPFAVSSPRSEELHQGVLALDGSVETGLGEFSGSRGRGGQGAENEGGEFHAERQSGLEKCKFQGGPKRTRRRDNQRHHAQERRRKRQPQNNNAHV